VIIAYTHDGTEKVTIVVAVNVGGDASGEIRNRVQLEDR
jgi:hypothetical protein